MQERNGQEVLLVIEETEGGCALSPAKNVENEVYKLQDFSNDSSLTSALNDVTILNLSNCNLENLPYSIQQLRLKQLILFNNKLREVPSLLYSGLISLEILNLSDNFIKSFDIEPACSLNLVRLNLDNNSMQALPQWILIGQTRKLSELRFNHNRVLSFEPYRKHSLSAIEMRNCGLLDCHLVALKSFKHLKSLDIGNNRGNGGHAENRVRSFDTLFDAPKWRRLERLAMDNLVISVLPHNLFLIRTIVEVSLVNCDLSWLPGDVQHLRLLEVIDVSENSLSALPRELCALPRLRVLRAADNVISEVAPVAAALRELDLYCNALEALPAGLEAVQLLDVEQNLFGACGEWYLPRVGALRAAGGGYRRWGPRRPPSPPPSEATKSDEGAAEEVAVEGEAEAGWLEERPWSDEEVGGDHVRNPQVTDSDDEWRGYEEVVSFISGSKSKMIISISQESLFSDID